MDIHISRIYELNELLYVIKNYAITTCKCIKPKYRLTNLLLLLVQTNNTMCIINGKSFRRYLHLLRNAI